MGVDQRTAGAQPEREPERDREPDWSRRSTIAVSIAAIRSRSSRPCCRWSGSASFRRALRPSALGAQLHFTTGVSGEKTLVFFGEHAFTLKQLTPATVV
jgi:hypothetical protein